MPDELPFWETRGDSTRLYLKATPNARKNGIEGTRVDAKGRMRLLIKVTAPPEDGKANKAIMMLLAKLLRLPKSAFAVVEGQTHREKVIAIAAALDEDDTAQLLN